MSNYQLNIETLPGETSRTINKKLFNSDSNKVSENVLIKWLNKNLYTGEEIFFDDVNDFMKNMKNNKYSLFMESCGNKKYLLTVGGKKENIYFFPKFTNKKHKIYILDLSTSNHQEIKLETIDPFMKIDKNITLTEDNFFVKIFNFNKKGFSLSDNELSELLNNNNYMLNFASIDMIRNLFKSKQEKQKIQKKLKVNETFCSIILCKIKNNNIYDFFVSYGLNKIVPSIEYFLGDKYDEFYLLSNTMKVNEYYLEHKNKKEYGFLQNKYKVIKKSVPSLIPRQTDYTSSLTNPQNIKILWFEKYYQDKSIISCDKLTLNENKKEYVSKLININIDYVITYTKELKQHFDNLTVIEKMVLSSYTYRGDRFLNTLIRGDNYDIWRIRQLLDYNDFGFIKTTRKYSINPLYPIFLEIWNDLKQFLPPPYSNMEKKDFSYSMFLQYLRICDENFIRNNLQIFFNIYKKIFERIMMKAPEVKKPFILFRGTKQKPEYSGKWVKSYSSSSLLRKVAGEFTQNLNSYDNCCITYILVKPGMKLVGLFWSAYPHEIELLIPPGCKWICKPPVYNKFFENIENRMGTDKVFYYHLEK